MGTTKSRTCTKCNIEKPLEDFHKKKTGRYGRHSQCNVCTLVRVKEYSDAKAEENRKLNVNPSTTTKVCATCNIEKPLNDFFKNRAGRLGRTVNCKSCGGDYSRKWKEANRDRVLANKKEWDEKNRDTLREKRKAYVEANKDKIREYERERRKTDPIYRLKKSSRGRVAEALRKGGYTKNSKTQEILGIDWERFQKHLEKTFKEGMSWDNYGEWHIDHIIPLASAKTEEELLKLLHYSNTQALWAEENIAKSDKLIEPTQVKLRI